MIQDPALVKIAGIKHGFFTRLGGVSEGWYESLNCAYASQDDPKCVEENRRRALLHFGSPAEALVTTRSRNGNQAVIVATPWLEDQKPEADAMVTKLPGIVLGSDSADCPIVLLVDDKSGVIGLAHAGWRGARTGILEATLTNMATLGAKLEHITAAMSPCIAQQSYEVGPEFYENFLEEAAGNKRYFIDSDKLQYFRFNLLGYVKDKLLQLHIKCVSTAATFDTYQDKRFFSYRRATHAGQADFGGHLSCISIA